MLFENRNYAFAGVFVDELVRCGLKHVCICPGSRSSPLAISFARHKQVKKWVHLDERSAGFFALGMARASRRPVALICSSGTAAANFSPAVIEAYYSGVPLLVLTADRPIEMHDWGALQTIKQANLYGDHVKWACAMPTPEVTNALLAFVRATACRAFYTAAKALPGPVHINFSFREPLEPCVVPTDFPDGINDALLRGKGSEPYLTSVPAAVPAPDEAKIMRLAREIAGKRGLIICGPDSGRNAAASIWGLAGRLDYPMLADCLSQHRCGKHGTQVIDAYDIFIDNEDMNKIPPEVIIRFGAVPVSKPLTNYIDRQTQARHIIIDPDRLWRNPGHTGAEVWEADAALFCDMVAESLKRPRSSSAWSRAWHDQNAKARAAVTHELSGRKYMFEGKIFHELANLLPADSILFAGNSMPIRDMDAFFPATGRQICFMANRGASGIDGVTSTALGAGAVSSGRVVLVVGDISFYHDMNGLLAAKEFGLDATIIVLNNDGGGIFSFLPQSTHKDVFEPYFGTPHGLTFRHAASLYGLDYTFADTWAKFTTGVKKSLLRKGTTIIEVPGNRGQNVALHREIRQNVLSTGHRKET